MYGHMVYELRKGQDQMGLLGAGIATTSAGRGHVRGAASTLRREGMK